MCVVCAFELRHTRTPLLRASGIDRAAALIGIGLRGQPRHRHTDIIWIAARGGAIGKGDLQHFGEMMDGRGVAEAHGGDIITLQNIQHLRDVHAGGRRRRRTENFPAAIIGSHRRAFDGPVGREVFAADKPAMVLHVVHQNVAERPLIQRRFAVARDGGERLGILSLYDALAGVQRRPVRQIDRRDRLVLAHFLCAIDDAFVQIGRRRKTARRLLDRRLHDVGEAHSAEPAQGFAPGLE
jgi:hypothetical protein